MIEVSFGPLAFGDRQRGVLVEGLLQKPGAGPATRNGFRFAALVCEQKGVRSLSLVLLLGELRLPGTPHFVAMAEGRPRERSLFPQIVTVRRTYAPERGELLS